MSLLVLLQPVAQGVVGIFGDCPLSSFSFSSVSSEDVSGPERKRRTVTCLEEEEIAYRKTSERVHLARGGA